MKCRFSFFSTIKNQDWRTKSVPVILPEKCFNCGIPHLELEGFEHLCFHLHYVFLSVCIISNVTKIFHVWRVDLFVLSINCHKQLKTCEQEIKISNQIHKSKSIDFRRKIKYDGFDSYNTYEAMSIEETPRSWSFCRLSAFIDKNLSM